MQAKSSTIDFSRRPAMRVEGDNRGVIRVVPPENVFKFENGIFGFEGCREFCFMINPKHAPFMFMQALDDTNMTFVCVEPFIIYDGYNVKIPESDVQSLELSRPADALILSLVTVRGDVEDITANLRSPVILNMANLKGRQVILEEGNYPIRFRVWDAVGDCRNFKVG